MSASSSSDSGVSSVSEMNETASRIGGSPIRVGDVDRDSHGDTCSFYRLEANQTCRRARTCYDCLNTGVSGEHDGCVLTPQGFCQTMDRYDYTLDYRRNVSSSSSASANGWYNFFPSANSTYCQPGDAACTRCQRIAASETSALLNTSLSLNSTEEDARQFCVGTQGCVCVVACEYASWNETVAEDCPNEPYAPTQVAQSEGYRTYFPILMGLQMLLLGTMMYRRRVFARNRNRNRAVPEGPYNDVRAISSPSNRLRLSGWRAGREAQMHREKNPRTYLQLDTPQLTEELQQQQQSGTLNTHSSESAEPKTSDDQETATTASVTETTSESTALDNGTQNERNLWHL